MKSIKDKDGMYHKKYYFEGNIESVQLFFETEKISKTISFTAKNTTTFGAIILMQNEKESHFLDANAKELFRIPFTPIQSLGSRYFQNDSLYYHLNLKTKKLDPLIVAHIWEAPNGLAFVKATKKDKHRIYNANYELLSEMVFDDIYTSDDHYVRGISNNESYILDAQGTISKLKGMSAIRKPFDGRMAAKLNGKFGFIATSGETVIPFEYIEVQNFNEGHAITAKENNKFGLIDTNGKTVLPFEYHKILSYENGIAWVSTAKGYQLIATTGKVLATAKGGSYLINGSGVEKTYTFGDKKYNAFGKLISKDN